MKDGLTIKFIGMVLFRFAIILFPIPPEGKFQSLVLFDSDGWFLMWPIPDVPWDRRAMVAMIVAGVLVIMK